MPGVGRPSRGPGGGRLSLVRRGRGLLFGVVVLACFGVLGLVWLVLGRARRQRRIAGCAVCRRQRRIAVACVSGFAVLLVIGAGVRTQLAMTPLAGCGAQFSEGVEQASEVVEAEVVEAEVLDPGWWGRARQAVTAPISGVALVGTRAAGMSHCSGSSVVVAFPPPPEGNGGGSVIGNIFVTWIPESSGPQVALPGQESYVRFNPGGQTEPAQIEAIARHESRHVDQWTAATLIGGPLAMPVAYYADSLLYPYAHNHFERHAGLTDGGYERPPDFAPEPLWVPLVLTGVLVLMVLRRRLRWASRVVSGGRIAGDEHRVDRCPLHTAGWFRADLRRRGRDVG